MAERAAKKESSSFVEVVIAVVQAVALALVIRTVLLQPFSIPSGSMIPTLLVGDYVLVTKWSYGYSKYSLPFSPDLFDGRILGSEPERGDVIVFRKPSDTDVDFIKRLIGLPGDTVQMRDGVRNAVIANNPDRRKKDLWTAEGAGEPVRNPWKDVGRNDPCPCGSGLKFKKCCLGKAA